MKIRPTEAASMSGPGIEQFHSAFQQETDLGFPVAFVDARPLKSQEDTEASCADNPDPGTSLITAQGGVKKHRENREKLP